MCKINLSQVSLTLQATIICLIQIAIKIVYSTFSLQLSSVIFQQLDFLWTCLLLIPTDDLLFASSNIDTVSLPCWSWSPVILELSFLILLSRIIFIFIICCATLIILIQIQMDVFGFSNTSTSIMKAINYISTLVSGSLSPVFTAISLSYWNWDFHKNCGPLNRRSRSLLLDSIKSFDA